MILFDARVVAPDDCTLPITSSAARFCSALVLFVEVLVDSNRLPKAMQWILTGLPVIENPPAETSLQICWARFCAWVAAVANGMLTVRVGNSVPPADRLLASAMRT